jgi:hypothetical protein
MCLEFLAAMTCVLSVLDGHSISIQDNEGKYNLRNIGTHCTVMQLTMWKNFIEEIQLLSYSNIHHEIHTIGLTTT